ncbi:hypothetical protein GCM10029963_67290 [Micromonospora andamanensis]
MRRDDPPALRRVVFLAGRGRVGPVGAVTRRAERGEPPVPGAVPGLPAGTGPVSLAPGPVGLAPGWWGRAVDSVGGAVGSFVGGLPGRARIRTSQPRQKRPGTRTSRSHREISCRLNVNTPAAAQSSAASRVWLHPGRAVAGPPTGREQREGAVRG